TRTPGTPVSPASNKPLLLTSRKTWSPNDIEFKFAKSMVLTLGPTMLVKLICASAPATTSTSKRTAVIWVRSAPVPPAVVKSAKGIVRVLVAEPPDVTGLGTVTEEKLVPPL